MCGVLMNFNTLWMYDSSVILQLFRIHNRNEPNTKYNLLVYKQQILLQKMHYK